LALLAEKKPGGRKGPYRLGILSSLSVGYFSSPSAVLLSFPSAAHNFVTPPRRREEAFVMTKYLLRYSLAACLLPCLSVLCVKTDAQPSAAALQAASTPSATTEIPAAELLQPEELVQFLRSSRDEKPLILQVGSHVLFAEAHISGSEYAGAGGQDTGLQALRDRVKQLERNRFLVIYCGCCPWNKCPNIRPAYQELHTLGFTHVRVLYLANNFGTDWVNKGYPVTKGR
jgi:thiosulfate/3-mercaptopyruvate sulfurtransferase